MINTTLPADEEQLTQTENTIKEVLESVELNPSALDPIIIERLAILHEATPTVEDELRAITMSQAVFDTAAEAGHAYSEEEKRTVIIGSLFTDIGKSGPKSATPEQSKLIASIFNVENLPPETVNGPIESFIDNYFGEDAEAAKSQLAKLGLDLTKLKMRDLYNLHTLWTLELTVDSGIPEEAVAAAASHHRLRGDNPGSILNDDDTFTHEFGTNGKFDRAEKLIAALDMYDAFTRRSGLSHEEALSALSGWLQKTAGGKYADDTELKQILQDLDAATSAKVSDTAN